MKRIGIIGLCFVVILAFGVVAVASASALEVLSSSATGTFKASGGASALFGASEIKCTAGTASGTLETAHLGTGIVAFTGCTTSFLGTHTCTGSGAKEGEIVGKGPAHIGLGMKSATDAPGSPAILFLVTPNAVFTCAGVGTVEVKGNVVGLLMNHANTAPLKVGENFAGAQLVFKSAKSTKQEDKEFLLSLTTPANENMSTKLESNLFGGGFSETGVEGTAEVTEVTPTGMHLVEG